MRTLLPLFLALLGACDGASEPSVRPGANERFLSPDLDVQQCLETFEGESREIATSASAIVAALGIVPGMHVADVGAGTGLFEALLDEAVGPEGKVWAIDIAPSFVDYLRDRVTVEGLSSVEVILGLDRSVPLPPASVDLVFVCDTYHHFEFPHSMLESMHAVLVPGGELVVIDFERIPGESRQWVLNHVRDDKQTFRQEIEDAGFVFDEEIEVDGLVENYVLRFRRGDTPPAER